MTVDGGTVPVSTVWTGQREGTVPSVGISWVEGSLGSTNQHRRDRTMTFYSSIRSINGKDGVRPPTFPVRLIERSHVNLSLRYPVDLSSTRTRCFKTLVQGPVGEQPTRSASWVKWSTTLLFPLIVTPLV